MQYTDTEAALISGLISTYFFQPAVSASLKNAYSRVLEHLHQNALTSSDLQQIRKAVNFLIPMCQANRQTQRELMGVNARTTALLNTSRRYSQRLTGQRKARFCDRAFLCPIYISLRSAKHDPSLLWKLRVGFRQ